MRNKIFFEKHIDKTPSELYNLHNGQMSWKEKFIENEEEEQ